MKNVPLTRVSTFQPFTRFLESGGSDVPRHLARIGVGAEILQDEESLIPLRLGCEFVQDVSRIEGVEHLGLQVGARTPMSSLGMLGSLLCQAVTLRDLVGKLVKWVPKVDSGAHVWTEPTGQEGAVRLCLRHRINVGRSIIDGFALLIFIDAVRMATGPDWRPKRVWLDAEGRGDLSAFEALSEAEVTRGVNYIAFEIPGRDLDLPVRAGASPGVTEDAIYVSAPPEDFVGSILRAIQSGFGARTPSTGEAAKLAGISARTFQRELRSQGVTYRKLLDRARFETAQSLLQNDDRPVADVAWHLGYGEISNFTHAFRRWAGVSPSEYRRKRQ